MTKIETLKFNTITWVDLAAADLPGALDFYSDVLSVDAVNDGETDYHIFTVDDGAAASGCMQLQPQMAEAGMPPVWSTYISVENAAATIEAVEAAGGSCFQQPFDIPGGGKIAVIADPAGAVICLFEGGVNMGFEVIDEPGAACWFDTMSRDADAAEAFYSTVFGWTATPIDGMPYRVFDLDGHQLGGMMAMDDTFPPQIPSHWSVSFAVSDTDATVERAVGKGATVVMPPADSPYGRMAGLVDPWGAGFNIIDRSTSVA